MFDAYREKLTNLLVSRTSQARMDEVGFFFEEFKPLDPGLHRVVEDNKSSPASPESFFYPVYGGVVLGLALSLSLRRYVSAFRNTPLPVRVLLEFGIVTATTSYGIWTSAIPNFLLAIHGLRCELITKSSPGSPDDPQYFRHLKRKYRSFPDVYKSEIRLFQEVLEEDAFLQWYGDSPQYVFEPGQSPQATDFKDAGKFESQATESGKPPAPATPRPSSN